MSKKIRIKRTEQSERPLRDIARRNEIGDPLDRLPADERHAVETTRKRRSAISARGSLPPEQLKVLDLEESRGTVKVHQHAAQLIQAELLDHLSDAPSGHKIVVEDPVDGHTVTGTLVRPSAGTQIDEDKLWELIDSHYSKAQATKIWETITARHLDADLITQAVADGVLDTGLVDKATEDRPAPKPSIRTSRRGTST